MSRLDFTSDKEEQKIYWSLSKIKSVGAIAVDNILQARDSGGEFFDLNDFLKRVPKSKVNKAVVTNLIIAGAFDKIGGKYGLEIKLPKERYHILSEYYTIIKQELPERIELTENKSKSWFWTLQQKLLTGFGNINYQDLIAQLKLKDKKFEERYVAPEDFELFENKQTWGTPSTIAGTIMFIRENKAKNGQMASISIESNNTIILMVVWPDALEVLRKQLFELNDSKKIIAISGAIKFDTYRGRNVFFTTKETKIYEIS
jgi:DNA polymerase-3 subunit alpha